VWIFNLNGYQAVTGSAVGNYILIIVCYCVRTALCIDSYTNVLYFNIVILREYPWNMLPPSSVLKAICSSERLAHIQNATQHNPEKHHLFSRRRENPKYYRRYIECKFVA
jgi:hypothetical protein